MTSNWPSWSPAAKHPGRLCARPARRLTSFTRGTPGRSWPSSPPARRGDLDDLNQEVWRRAWHHLPEQFRGGNFRGWLHQIARNAVIDHARKRRPELLEDADSLPDGRHGRPESRLIERERSEALRNCLGRLSAVAAELVRARLGGDPYEDICKRLGLPPPRVHKMFHRAKEQLQTCLEESLA